MSKFDSVNRDVGEEPYAESWFTVADKLVIKSLTVNFLHSWWHKNYKVSFGKRYVYIFKKSPPAKPQCDS